eukprot:4936582-Heterocapsa_arctica.AAC.1
MPGLSFAEALEVGLSHDTRGRPLDPYASASILPCVQVVPMGWTWAFWLIQRLHTFVITQCGILPRSIVTGDLRCRYRRRPSPYPFVIT